MASKKYVMLLLRNKKLLQPFSIRHASFKSNAEVTQKRNVLFSKELERQKSLVSRVEKIEVDLIDPSFGCKLMMNKNISTPFDCARHTNNMMTNRSVLALVDGNLWDLHRPLRDNCQLKFLHFEDNKPMISNIAYWRSCSFMLGYILERAFKDNIYVQLHSWPKIDLTSGSFVYDVDLKTKNWVPKPEELRTLGGMSRALAVQNFKFERLVVEPQLALNIFEDNQYKCEQIPSIASQREAKDLHGVVLYRLGDHVDLSSGPMIASTHHLGMFTVAAAHQITLNDKLLYRFQGVSLPVSFRLGSFAFNVLIERAKKLNSSGLESERHDEVKKNETNIKIETKNEPPVIQRSENDEIAKEKVSAIL